MIALLDADNIAFACAASAEDADTPEIAIFRANDMLDGILSDTQATAYELWLSGQNNFRYKVYPEYKANRVGAIRPRWEKHVREALVNNWQANTTDGIEADDMIGIRSQQIKNCVICHLDKDLNQLPGLHFTWELKRKGVVVKEKAMYEITKEQGDYNFFYQLIVGDPTDNIKGINNYGPKKAERILQGNPREDWYNIIADLYGIEDILDLNAQCIYIWRKENDSWRNLIETSERKSERQELAEQST